MLTGGPWFYGQSLFVMTDYDGLQVPICVLIEKFSVWVDIKGLPDALMTDEAAEKVRLTLGHVEQLNIRRGTRVRVRILHHLKDPVREAFGEMSFEI